MSENPYESPKGEGTRIPNRPLSRSQALANGLIFGGGFIAISRPIIFLYAWFRIKDAPAFPAAAFWSGAIHATAKAGLIGAAMCAGGVILYKFVAK